MSVLRPSPSREATYHKRRNAHVTPEFRVRTPCVVRAASLELTYCPVRLAAAGAPGDEETCTSSIGERKWNPGMEGFVACHFKRLYNRRIFRLFNAMHSAAFLSFHMTNDFVVRIRVALWQWFESTALFHIASSLSRSNEIFDSTEEKTTPKGAKSTIPSTIPRMESAENR